MAETARSSLEAARAAFAARDWEGAFALFSAADAESRLGPEDLEALGEAAWIANHYDDFFRAYERAYAAHLGQGDRRAADSRDSLADADADFAVGDVESVQLKGVAEPVAVVAVRWN